MSEENKQEVGQEVEQELDKSKEVEQKEVKQEDKPMVSVAEMKRRLQNERERIEQEKQQEIEEAHKLAKMNEEEKREHEFNKLKEELDKLKQKETRYGLSREASNMLAEHGIQADDATLQFVVKDDADTTKEAVNAFVGLINAKVEEGVKKALSGNAPRVGAGNKGLTYDSIMDIKDTEKRQKLIKENLHLFK